MHMWCPDGIGREYAPPVIAQSINRAQWSLDARMQAAFEGLGLPRPGGMLPLADARVSDGSAASSSGGMPPVLHPLRQQARPYQTFVQRRRLSRSIVCEHVGATV